MLAALSAFSMHETQLFFGAAVAVIALAALVYCRTRPLQSRLKFVNDVEKNLPSEADLTSMYIYKDCHRGYRRRRDMRKALVPTALHPRCYCVLH
ncbi:hypothetical protein QBC46DRAFT_392587 [Diplogelasinospora grovesii]|uniref:Uncharacterized protein n=1 Tax=Diplogelasinospora grovesii TaxID=303347 RepID=A0AAN6S1Z0_9PEZI|nr:hypothetical protein QBC46DRAFT_392587 [Diplogelasinospora grovesii]